MTTKITKTTKITQITKIKTKNIINDKINNDKIINDKIINDKTNDYINYDKEYPISYACVMCKKKNCFEHSVNYFHHDDRIKETAGQILDLFENYDEVILLAQTQSGKSDVIKRIAELCENNKDTFSSKYKIENIILLLLVADVHLLQNHKKEFYNFIDDRRVIHLPDILSITNKILNPSKFYISKSGDYKKQLMSMLSDNCLIIVDEAHADQDVTSAMAQFRSAVDIEYNTDHKFKKNIKILNISATAYEHVQTGMPVIILHPGPEYWGIQNIFENNKIFPAYGLTQQNSFNAFINHILIQLKANELPSKYIIIRVHNDKEEKQLITYIKSNEKTKKCLIGQYNMKTIGDINDLYLKIEPPKPFIIIIKGKLTKGHRIIKQFIAAVHDTPNNTYVHTTYQSLLGRVTGYNSNKEILVYCDILNAKEHLLWVSNNYKLTHIPKAKYVNSTDGLIKPSSLLYDENL